MTRDDKRKILSDVYFIPDLRSNIISLGQATESGCDVRMRGDHLTLYDRDGNLMVKTKRSTNRLYKVTMEAEGMKFLQLADNSDSAVWHARLGHVSTDTMKSMIT